MADMFPFVSVEWFDAWADGSDTLGPHDQDTKHRPTLMETRGWMLGDNDVGISLFNERCLDKGDEIYRSRTFILRSMVKKVTILNTTRVRRPRVKTPPPDNPDLNDKDPKA